jgi:hypothetical protein
MLWTHSSKKRSRRLSPSPEGLEVRSLLAGDSPTAIEQLYLEELDDARFNPAAFGASLGLDLSSVAPSQPLAMSPLLVEAARDHSQDMIAQNYFSHVTPQGVDPVTRIQDTGFPGTGWAESIETNTQSEPAAVGFPANYAALNTLYSLDDLIVDQGVPDLGHRVMLLDIGGSQHALRQVGIGLSSQDTADGSSIDRETDTTIDLASTSDDDPFLTGVVFHDLAGNGEYEPGDGLGGVTITVSNVTSTTTLDAGGYSIQLAPGTYTVTASGAGLPNPITRTVVIGNDNVRLNFDENPNGTTFSAIAGDNAAVTLGSFKALEAGDTAASYSGRIDWANGTDSTATLVPNGDGGFTVTGVAPYTADGTYAVRVLSTRLSDGQSIALNGAAVVTGATAQPPTIIRALPLFQRKLKSNGKPGGKVALVGYSFQASVPLNASTALDPSFYQVDTVSAKHGKKGAKRALHAVTGFSVSLGGDNTVVNLIFARKPTFPTGGLITLIPGSSGGITGASGVSLVGNLVFTISPGGRVIRA